MDKRRKLIAGAVAVAAFAGGGAALAADQLGFKQQQSAVIDDAAASLGVKPSALTDALESALEKQIDAAVAAGTLTKEQGAEMKQRLADGDVPLLAFPGGGGDHHGGPGHFGGLDAAATYLGLTETELRDKLVDGTTTLADVAKAQGKTVDGLEQAMLDAAKKDLAQAVADGRLTAAQQQQILADLPARIAEHVNNAFEPGHGPGHGGPPGAFGGFPGAPGDVPDGQTQSGTDA